MPDFIPPRDGDLRNWADNFKAKIAIHGPTLGYTAAQVTALQNRCDNLNTKISIAEQRKADYQESVTDKETIKNTEIVALRTEANRIKTNANYTSAIGEDLSIVGSGSTPPDPGTYKPDTSGQAFQGYNRITFKKKGVDGINIYRRNSGTTDWGNKIAFDSNSPYDDHSVTPGTAYEYMAIGVIDDAEIGLPSDVVLIRAL